MRRWAAFRRGWANGADEAVRYLPFVVLGGALVVTVAVARGARVHPWELVTWAWIAATWALLWRFAS